ncbi:MAG: hypothetical protein ABSG91_05740 [Syntrophobacteraceae bacterium]
MLKQMIDFNKATFDNAFNAMALLQEQTERMTKNFVDQAASLPDEGRKGLNDWIQAIEKGREEFKKAVDRSFSNVEAYFEQADKQG